MLLYMGSLYIAAMLLYMGSISLDIVSWILARTTLGSVYRSPQLYAHLRTDMDADNSTDADLELKQMQAFVDVQLQLARPKHMNHPNGALEMLMSLAVLPFLSTPAYL
ncbi:hypothetical protein ABZP36_026018 [Zizania latifolia]